MNLFLPLKGKATGRRASLGNGLGRVSEFSREFSAKYHRKQCKLSSEALQSIIGSNKFSREFLTPYDSLGLKDSFIPHAE